MKKIFPAFISAILFLIVPFAGVSPAYAHGDGPRIEISPEKLNPGSPLDIRGYDFEFEEQVSLSLSGTQTVVSFGTVLTDLEGLFLLTIVIPADTPEGVYEILATTEDQKVIKSLPITVSGMAIVEGEGEAREEDDGLLAPMPTYAPGMSSTPLPEAVMAEGTTSGASNPYLLWGITGVAILLIVAYIRLKRR